MIGAVEAGHVLLLDAGDAFSRQDHATEKTSYQLRLAAETLLEAMGAMGYAAMGLGEGDLVFGGRFVREVAAGADFPILSASIVGAETLEPLVREAAVLDVGPLRVGVASVLSEDLAGFVAGHQDPDDPLAVIPADEAMRRGLEGIGGDADLRILLLHAPYDAIPDLLRRVPGYQIVIAGHDTAFVRIAEPEWIAGAALVQTGWDGERMGRLDLRVDPDGTLAVERGEEIALDATFPDDPEMVALHDEYLDRVAGAIDAILADYPVVPPPSGTRYVGTDVCTDCHDFEANEWSTTRHAQAWRTLADRRRDYDPTCFACHTTGFGFEGGFRVPDTTPDREDVGCESCHGAGGDHVEATGASYGFPVDEARCRTCHTAAHSPQFDYPTALPKILHGG